MQRPTQRDDRVLAAVAAELLADFQNAFDEVVNTEEALASILSAIRYENDGYAICRKLDDDGWDCDAALVTIMDNTAGYKAKHWEELQRQWVIENSIVPALAIDATVRFKRQGKDEKGVISAIDTEKARYTVFCEHLGHVREGIGTHGIIVPYESCTAVEAL